MPPSILRHFSKSWISSLWKHASSNGSFSIGGYLPKRSLQQRAHIEDPTFNRLMQQLYLESSRLILDCIFTPEDPSNSRGPVVGGVHDALRRLRYHWEGDLFPLFS